LRYHSLLVRLGATLLAFALCSNADALSGESVRVSPDRPSHGFYSQPRVNFAFSDDYRVRLRNAAFQGAPGRELEIVHALLESRRTKSLDRLFYEHDEALLAELKREGEERRKRVLPDLNNWYTCVLDDDGEALELGAALSRLPVIRSAYRVRLPQPMDDIAPPTPDYTPQQDYHDTAPAGVGIASAWAENGGDGSQVSVCHVEGGWILDHEDFSTGDFSVEHIGGGNSTDSGWYMHGTACMSIMVAPDNGYGVTGLARSPEAAYVRGIFSGGSPNAWIAAGNQLEPGDVISASWGYSGQLPPGYSCDCNPYQAGGQPAESDQADFDALSTVTANGRIVLNSAANGCVPMDHEFYNGMYDLQQRDSGVLIIGASEPDRFPICYTNYGSRIDAFSWGTAIYSAGYGDLFEPNGDERQCYTSDFGGTSGATPIVSGCVAALQSYYKQAAGLVLDAWQMRDLLRSTGSPQTGDYDRPISNMPDLAQLIEAVQVYMGGVVYESHTVLADDNSNGVVEPGETVDLEVGLRCISDSTVTEVSVSITGASEWIDVIQGQSDYPVFEPGDVHGNLTPFMIQVDPAAPPIHEAVIQFEMVADGQSSAAEFTLAVGQRSVYHSEDFEQGGEGWWHEASEGWGDQWHLSTADSFDGEHSWKCGDEGAGDYASSLDALLVSPDLAIEPYSRLRFQHRIQAEASAAFPDSAYDGGLVEFSADEGQSWNTLSMTEGGYTHAFRGQAGGGNPATHNLPGGTPCWSDQFDWRESAADLADFGGQTLRFRFHFGSDSGTNYEGWYVDRFVLEGYVTQPDLEAVDDLSIAYAGGPTLILDWSPVQGATAYRVEMLIPGDDLWLELAMVTQPGYEAALAQGARIFRVISVNDAPLR